MKISVIIPCWNEEEGVVRFATELWPVLEKLNFDFEVVVVDDGSVDKTVEELKKINKPQLRLMVYSPHKGLGAAVRAGIAASTGDYTVVLDSDFTFHPNLIPALLTALQANPQADFIIGSPNLGGYGENIPAWRMFVSKVANAVYRILLGKPITSINQIFRLYKTEELKDLSLEAIGFDINAEILFKLVFRGKKFIEVPAKLTSRIYGTSKLNYVREIRRHFILILKIIKWKLFGYG